MKQWRFNAQETIRQEISRLPFTDSMKHMRQFAADLRSK